MLKLPKAEGKILFNENMAKYSWFGVGGNAEVLFQPKNLLDLQNFLMDIDKSIPLQIIGGGSNLLIRDGGLNGVTILLKNSFKSILLQEDYIEVESGILNSEFFSFVQKNGISGYEFLGTIPGTIGGSIIGNAGSYGSEIKDFLISLEVIDFNGKIYEFSNSQCGFEYRKSTLDSNLIITKAKFKINEKKPAKEILINFTNLLNKKIETQPINQKTCGSTFKNPIEKPAWKLISELGYQNKEIDGAKMSEMHANFMINTGKATATSLENLGNLIIKEAKEKQNINLEWEIKIIGKAK